MRANNNERKDKTVGKKRHEAKTVTRKVTIPRDKTGRKYDVTMKVDGGKGKNGKAETTTKYGRPGTIKNVVIDLFHEDTGISNEDMVAAVKKEFPDSAFDAKHASWYRMQAKKGNLTGTPIAIPKKAAGTK